jgi:hypothetical protein
MSDFETASKALTAELLALSPNDRVTLLVQKLAANCIAMASDPNIAKLNITVAKYAFDTLANDAIKYRWPTPDIKDVH